MFIFEASKAMRSTNTCVKKYFQIKKSTAFFSFLPMNFKFLNFWKPFLRKYLKDINKYRNLLLIYIKYSLQLSS